MFLNFLPPTLVSGCARLWIHILGLNDRYQPPGIFQSRAVSPVEIIFFSFAGKFVRTGL